MSCLRKPLKAKARGYATDASPLTSKVDAALRPVRAMVWSGLQCTFYPDMYVPCDACHGKRYNRKKLEVSYKGRNISDV